MIQMAACAYRARRARGPRRSAVDRPRSKGEMCDSTSECVRMGKRNACIAWVPSAAWIQSAAGATRSPLRICQLLACAASGACCGTQEHLLAGAASAAPNRPYPPR
jgi:hypothetical protein